VILQLADLLSKEHSLEVRSIMGPRSVLVTWDQLTLSANKDKPDAPIATPWPHADALAEAILLGGTEQIVVDSLPTPPASEEDYLEEEYKKRHKKHKRSPPSSLLAVMGAVGAVGVAALLMYGAGKTGISL
jgi:hypothetical protein